MTDDAPNPTYTPRSTGRRMLKDRGFQAVCVAAALMAIVVLVALLGGITFRGVGRLDATLVTGFHSSEPTGSGMLPAIVGSVWLLIICACTAIPLGVGTAILLEEFRPRHKLLQRVHGFIQLNITNLAGVPSIVYGILGLTVFANSFFGMFTQSQPAIGDHWYHQYAGAGGGYYYVAVDDRDAELRPASADLTYLASTARRGARAEVRVLTNEEVAPIRAAVDARVDPLSGRIRELVEAQRASRRAPAAITPEEAEVMAASLLADAEFAADRAQLVEAATAGFAAMNGMGGGEVALARRALGEKLKEIERAAAGLRGVVVAGTMPTPVEKQSWWFLRLPFGRSLLAGGLTLTLVVLPIIIVASQEAIRAVPGSMRQGALALGGTKWQAIQSVVMPAAVPGICTGTILAMSRAIGEAAPILMIGALYIFFVPGPRPWSDGSSNLMSDFTAMPLQIFRWASLPNEQYRDAAAAGIIVLLTVLLSFNALAVFIRARTSRQH